MAITLTDPERRELRALAERLAGTEPRLLDDPGWVAAARAMAGALPERLRATLREYRHDPGPQGALLIGGLPFEEAEIPPTPSVAESVERFATVPAAIQVLISLQLGEIGAYRSEKGGALVQNVVPVPGKETFQGNAGSTVLEMHVENAFHVSRPDYVGLMCLRNDHGNQAKLRVSCIRRALCLVDDKTERLLHEARFVTDPPPSFGGRDAAAEPHAVLTGDRADPNVQVDFTSTHPLDDEAAGAMEQLEKAFAEVAEEVLLQRGELALVDNRLALHGRTSFVPRYDGRDRWLHRTFVHLDARRTRAQRPGGGHVLT